MSQSERPEKDSVGEREKDGGKKEGNGERGRRSEGFSWLVSFGKFVFLKSFNDRWNKIDR